LYKASCLDLSGPYDSVSRIRHCEVISAVRFFAAFCGYSSGYTTAKVSEEVNRKLPASSTVQF